MEWRRRGELEAELPALPGACTSTVYGPVSACYAGTRAIHTGVPAHAARPPYTAAPPVAGAYQQAPPVAFPPAPPQPRHTAPRPPQVQTGPAPAPGTQNYGHPPRAQGCYQCGMPGHMKRDCPQNPYNQGYNNYNQNAWYYPSAELKNTADPSGGTPNPSTTGSRAGCNIVRLKKANPETYMDIYIARHHLACLLDTGCDHSLIPYRLVPGAFLSPVNFDVYAANGARVEILGCTEAQFFVQECWTRPSS